MSVRTRRRMVAWVSLVVLFGASVTPAGASHGTFIVSTGVYRIPYVDGTDLTVTQDHHTHGGVGGNKDRIDMTAGQGGADRRRRLGLDSGDHRLPRQQSGRR